MIKPVGRFQILYMSIIICGMLSGSFILYAVNYFELEPKMQCIYQNSTDWVACTAKQICKDQKDIIVTWRIDYTNNLSLRNWFQQYNLMCEPISKTSLIGSFFFVGTFTGSFILPPLADVKGRKPMFLIGLGLYIFNAFGFLFGTNLYLLYFLMFMGGFCETGRYYVAYVYVVEILPKRL